MAICDKHDSMRAYGYDCPFCELVRMRSEVERLGKELEQANGEILSCEAANINANIKIYELTNRAEQAERERDANEEHLLKVVADRAAARAEIIKLQTDLELVEEAYDDECDENKILNAEISRLKRIIDVASSAQAKREVER